MAIFRDLPILGPHMLAFAADLPIITTTTTASTFDDAEAAACLSPSAAAQMLNALPKPDWLRIRPPAGEKVQQLKKLLRQGKLHTVCEEAHCPNLAECWSSGTATFMLGGEICTRACRFCAVKTARRPPPLDPKEPLQVAESIAQLGLSYVVLTSVNRDDLADGGAGHFAQTIQAIKRLNAEIRVEALVPDFKGDSAAVQTIVDSGVDVYAHNLETVFRLQKRVRDPRAHYEQSLATLGFAKRYALQGSSGRGKLLTKSSVMLGLGETESELEQAFHALRCAQVDVLTLGQYLRPSPQHLPVVKYWSPAEFATLGRKAEAAGFAYVAAGPMVRSSYRAGEFFLKNLLRAEAEGAAPGVVSEASVTL